MAYVYDFQKRAYGKAESSNGIAAGYAGSDAIKLISFDPKYDQNAEVRRDYHPGTRDPQEEVLLDVRASYTATAYALSSGAQGTEPDISFALETEFTQASKTATTVAASPSPTTTTFKLTADNLDAGDIGKITVTSATGIVVERRYFYVVSKDVSDVLTITPALSVAPQALDAVVAVLNYSLAIDNTGTFSLHGSDNAGGQSALGCILQKASWKFTAGNTGELTIEGPCRWIANTVQTTLSGSINDSVTTVPVTDVGVEAGTILICGTEQMYVSDVSANGLSLTVTRGFNSSSPASHTSGDAIGPYRPTPTTSGTPIKLSGGLWIDGDQYEAADIEINYDGGGRDLRYWGDGGVSAGKINAADRQISFTANVHGETDIFDKMRNIKQGDSYPVFVQAGDANGASMAFYMPAVVFQNPAIPNQPGEIVKVALQSRVVLGVAGEDSFKFAF